MYVGCLCWVFLNTATQYLVNEIIFIAVIDFIKIDFHSTGVNISKLSYLNDRNLTRDMPTT